MSATLAMTTDGKKFMWDGNIYATHEEAVGAAESYRSNDFDVRIVKEENNVLVYSRRVVKGGALPPRKAPPGCIHANAYIVGSQRSGTSGRN
jgi:hypothetical protein